MVFTIYKHSPHLVNVTGLINFSGIESYRKDLEKRLQQKLKHVRMDNAFFTEAEEDY